VKNHIKGCDMNPAEPSYRVVVLEDDVWQRRSLVDQLSALPYIQCVGDFALAKLAMQEIETLAPDVLLVDLALPDQNGTEVIRHVRKVLPQCDCIVISVFTDDSHIIEAIRAGAAGYLMKGFMGFEIDQAIQMVKAGEAPITPKIARKLIQAMQSKQIGPGLSDVGSEQAVSSPIFAQALTPREIEVLQCISKGNRIDDIAVMLNISAHTVRVHVKKVYVKLEAHSTQEAIYKGKLVGIISH
jgi:DNA-binding NarL/FixJ family response regulator